MTEQSVTNANTKVDRTAKTVQRIVIAVLCAGVLFVVVPPFLPGTKAKTVPNMIRQFQGKAYYWNRYGDKPGVAERLFDWHYGVISKITAARMLGEMGPRAVDAVPALIAELEHGPNDIETGDGAFPYRSEIALALGKIGDKRAIRPLMEKLKIREKATFSSGYSGGTFPHEPLGIGHPAIVEALGMFGKDASEAVPFIRALADTEDNRLQRQIKEALARIENAGHDPELPSDERHRY
jgi:hypothetical protein